MDIGIGLPATIPGTKGSLVLDWAERADSASFSSLGVLDRMVYPNYEPLIALAAAAAGRAVAGTAGEEGARPAGGPGRPCQAAERGSVAVTRLAKRRMD